MAYPGWWILPLSKTDPTTIAEWVAAHAGGLPYKVYTARVDQSGEDAPVATVLQNTLSGTPTWSRWGAGGYFLTLAGAFTEGKVAIFVSGGEPNDHLPYLFVADWFDVDKMQLYVYVDLGQMGDTWYAYVEVRVYD